MTTYAVDTPPLVGTSAQRAATTPPLRVPGIGPFWLETDTGLLYVWTGAWSPVGGSLSKLMDLVFGSTRGGVIFRGAAGWQFMGPGTNGQVLTTLGGAVDPVWAFPAGARPLLGGDLTIFVATTGSDSNDGLTVSTPLLTGQAALTKLAAFDLNNHTATVQFADGTYPGAISVPNSPWSTGNLVLQGNLTTPANVIFSFGSAGAGQTLTATGYATVVTVKGVTFSGSPLAFLFATNGGTIQFDKCVFGGNAFFQLWGNIGGIVRVLSPAPTVGGSYTISSSPGQSHARADTLGQVILSSATVTLTGTINLPVGFAQALAAGVITANSAVFTGSATGPKFNVGSNATIFTGAAVTFLPGSTAGVNDGTGVYA